MSSVEYDHSPEYDSPPGVGYAQEVTKSVPSSLPFSSNKSNARIDQNNIQQEDEVIKAITDSW